MLRPATHRTAHLGFDLRVGSGTEAGRLLLLVVLLFVLVAEGVWAQQQAEPARYVRTQWTAEDGLPVNSVNDIVQTEDGYLWLATYDGLVRFDGIEFKVYRSAQHEGLSSNRILKLLVRDDGIWLRTESRDLIRFHDGHFTSIAQPVSVYRQGPKGRLWIGTNQGLFVYHDKVRRPVAPELIQAQVVTTMVEDDGTVWVGTEDQGVFRRGPDGHVRHLGLEQLRGRPVGMIAKTGDGTVWLGSWGKGLWRWTGGRLISASVPSWADPPVVALAFETDVSGASWLATDHGIFRRNGDSFQRALRFSEGTYNPSLIPHKGFVKGGPRGHTWLAEGRTLYRDQTPVFEAERPIERFLFDQKGTLWIGTPTQGLFRLRPSLFTVYGLPEGLASDNIYPIEQRRDGDVWLGTIGGGLSRVDSQGDVTNYRLEKDGRLNNVWALHEDRSGDFWVGGSELCRLVEGRCARSGVTGPIEGTRIQVIFEDRGRTLWVGTSTNGLYRCNHACGTAAASWKQFVSRNSRLPHSYVRTIHETPGGALWVGTNGGGIARYEGGSFVPLTTDDGLSSNLIRDIYQDTTETGSSNVLWVVTEDQGLNRVELSPSDTAIVSSITVYRKQDGLYDNAIHQILQDEQGRFWISSNRGLFWVRKEDLEAFARGETERIQSVSYTTREGLRTREANGGVQPAGLKAQDGRLWFPTQKGAAVIDPAAVPTEVSPPPVHVEALTSNDRVLSRRPDRPVRLTPNQRSFEVSYTGIRLSNPEGVEFRYRLAGLQSEWQQVGHRRRAFFTNVPPGRYTFEVAAQVRGGAWSNPPTQLTLTVAPYFYETWWFYGLCLFALGMIGVGATRYWFYRQRRREERLRRRVEKRTEELAMAKQQAENAFETVAEQAEQLRRLDEMKSRFFANVSHELRTPLSLIRGPIMQMLEENETEQTDGERDVLRIVSRNAERLERLVEQLLDLARYDAGHLDLSLRQKPLGSFVERTVQRFRPLADRQSVELSFRTGTGSADRPVAFDPDHLETVIANLIRNALKYTSPEGRVSVEAAVEGDEAVLRVHDTGPGIPEEEQKRLFDRFYRGTSQTQVGGTGIGLALTKALMTLHEGAIEVDSSPGDGSTFTVRWPVGLGAGDASDGEQGKTEPDALDAPLTSGVSGDGMSGSGEPFSGLAAERPVADRSVSFEAPDGTSSDRTTVLVMDDNADVRRYVRSLLEPHYRVLEADDGRSGLERTRTLLPDLLIADVMMPEMDGFEVVRKLRQSERTDCIPVVMLTARAEEADQVEGLAHGADAYVTKPFDADVLTAQVDRLLAARRQLRARFRAQSFEGSEAGSPAEPSSEETNSATFEEEIRSIVEGRLADPEFGVEQLAEAAAVSRRHLTKKVKETFERTPSRLIREIRLEAGAALLEDDTGTISEVAYAVGFNSLSYFSRSFKEHFGVSPSAYRKEE